MAPDKPFADQHPENPQSWNLYAYGFNNPLKNVDIGGNCVAPAVGNGQVGICVETYIQAKRFGFLNLGHGDNRGPVANDPGASFRTQSLLTVDLGWGVTQQSRAGMSESDFTFDLDVVHASLSNQSVDKNGTVSFTLSVYGENGAEARGNPFAPGGWIELVSSFQVAADGTVKLIGPPSTKPFPSVSMYVYLPNGKIVDLFEKKESGNVNDLNKPRFPADNTHCSPQTCSDVTGGNGFLSR